MIPPAGRGTATARLALVAALYLAITGCGHGGNAAPSPSPGSSAPPSREFPSHAADATIEKAKTPEERRALEKARDEVDAEMREKVRVLDAEIERIRRENEALRAEKKK